MWKKHYTSLSFEFYKTLKLKACDCTKVQLMKQNVDMAAPKPLLFNPCKSLQYAKG